MTPWRIVLFHLITIPFSKERKNAHIAGRSWNVCTSPTARPLGSCHFGGLLLSLHFWICCFLLPLCCVLQVLSKDDPPRKTYVYSLRVPVTAECISLTVGPFEIFPDRQNAMITHLCLSSNISRLRHTMGFFYNAYRYLQILVIVQLDGSIILWSRTTSHFLITSAYF